MQTGKIYENTPGTRDFIGALEFTRTPYALSPDFWMKKQSWFWADPQKYEEYKKNVRK